MTVLTKSLKVCACNFCGEDQYHVEQLIAGPNDVMICNVCVWLCVEIIAENRVKAREQKEKS